MDFNEENLNKLKGKELKEICIKLGIAKYGNKSEIIQRIMNNKNSERMNENNHENENDNENDNENERKITHTKNKKRETPKDGVMQQQWLLNRQNKLCRGPNDQICAQLGLQWKCPMNRLFKIDGTDLTSYPGGYHNDHRIRCCEYGSNTLDNRQLLCQMCHGYKTELETRKPCELNQYEINELKYFQEPYNEKSEDHKKYISRRKPINELNIRNL